MHQGDVKDQGLNGDARRRRGPDQSDTARIPDARILTGRVVPLLTFLFQHSLL